MRVIRTMQVRKVFLLAISSIFGIVMLLIITHDSPINDIDRKFRLEKIDELIHSQASSLACKQPNLPVFSPEMMKFVHEESPIDCSSAGTDWVKCEGSECRIQDEIKAKYGRVTCSFTDIIRINDFELTNGETTHSDSYYKLEKSDVVKVSCRSQTAQWSATLTGIRLDKTIWERASWSKLPPDAVKYNVLMFGFDSISRNSFVRKLPKSYKFLTEILHGDVLQGYNIIGDGTPQALIPILTGKTELELPDTRKRFTNTKFVNSYPFIWNEYRNAGYVTGFYEDVPELGTFTYRLNGFNETPTDHYMRPYYLASLGERRKWPKLCTGEIPRHQVMFNQIKNFFTVYKPKPKFLFGFHGELSHDDYNLVGVADDDFFEFLHFLKDSGVLDDTILIVMADHGHRFAEIRNTIQGKQEERLPFFSFTFPESFKKHFKQAYENFQHNIDKLSTPFDVHFTLKSLLELNDIGEANINYRAVSLFTKIPGERSCSHAYIEPHWCACLDWEKIPLSDPIVNRISNLLIATLNDYTKPHRHMCQELSVADIEWVMRMTPNENLLKYNKNADLDGFVADLSAKIKIKTNLYQIKVVVTPGNSVFEASVTYFIDEDKLNVKMSDISRVNMYGKQARCVEDNLPDLRKYCYCKD
ncbi:uncharacterized protein LOC123013800 [Tribolium madens]|uniref:uncharacterized protein LOC123013800 n=1 Tax=Tribolium madens TaxID=41895 RepID=UPI001CF74A09|nr:uncharacterized protein LOC123013800 [Tribolium madens]